MGLSDDRYYARFHHVLNRAAWSPLKVSRILLGLLILHLDRGEVPLIFGIDETLERRRGLQISALGIYRDAVRSSRSYVVKASGLRWVSLMWLGHIPWAGRCWALPFLTVLAPSERYCRRQGRPRKKLTDWARQMILQLRRWLPAGHWRWWGTAATLSWTCSISAIPSGNPLPSSLYCVWTPDSMPRHHRAGQVKTAAPGGKARVRPLLDHPPVAWYGGSTRIVELASQTAVWYHSGKPPVPIRWVLVRDPQGEFDTQALLCTNPEVAPAQILEWFALRWQLEATFQEVRAHLGVGRPSANGPAGP